MISAEKTNLMKKLNETFKCLDLAKLNHEVAEFKINEIKEKVLIEGDFRCEETGEKITDPRLDFTMGDENFDRYLEVRFPLLLEAGFKVESKELSALYPFSKLVRHFEDEVIELSEKLTGQKLECISLMQQREFIEKARNLIKRVNFKEGQ